MQSLVKTKPEVVKSIASPLRLAARAATVTEKVEHLLDVARVGQPILCPSDLFPSPQDMVNGVGPMREMSLADWVTSAEEHQIFFPADIAASDSERALAGKDLQAEGWFLFAATLRLARLESGKLRSVPTNKQIDRMYKDLSSYNVFRSMLTKRIMQNYAEFKDTWVKEITGVYKQWYSSRNRGVDANGSTNVFTKRTVSIVRTELERFDNCMCEGIGRAPLARNHSRVMES